MNYDQTRFLILRLSSIGDVLHAAPVAHALKKASPGCHITWLASPPASDLLKYNPDIDELLVWDRRPFDKAASSLHLRQVRAALRKAKKLFELRHFDIALDIQGLFLTGLLAKMSKAPRRIGIHERHEFNHLFMTEQAEDIADPHKIRRYLSVLAPLGIQDGSPELHLELPPEMDTFAGSFLHRQGIDPGRRILYVNLRTTWPDKNWLPESFAAALQAVPADVQLVFCGAKGDQPYIDTVQRLLGRPMVSIAGKTSLLELAAIFRKGTLLLTGDTGPLYIAAGVGLPTLSLWGPTHPDIYGPLNGPHEFILTPYSCHSCCKTHCRKKTNDCMKAIETETVKNKLIQLLK